MNDDYEDWLEKKLEDEHEDRHARKANEKLEAERKERDEKYYEICENRIRDTLAARKLARMSLNKLKESV